MILLYDECAGIVRLATDSSDGKMRVYDRCAAHYMYAHYCAIR